jgi:hypothetical protein
VLRGVFGAAEQEIAAMCLIGYLTSKDAEWTTEFSWHELVRWMHTDATSSLNAVYCTMIHTYGPQFVTRGFAGLTDNEYLTLRGINDKIFCMVTDSFVEIMRRTCI